MACVEQIHDALERGRKDDAATLARQLASCTPEGRLGPRELWDHHVACGLAFFHADAFEEAARHFEVLVQLAPKGANVRFMLAKCYDMLDRVEQAAKHYEEVLRVDPLAPAASCFLGMVYEDLGRTAEAARQYKDALATDPDDSVAAERLLKLEAES